jgi:quercetin dioxygenase-like cupin family protein
MTIIDLDRVDRTGPSGAVWSLEDSDELNANLVVLAPGDSIPEHVNDELDVLCVVLGGEGVLVVDGRVWHLEPHISVLVPRGARRRITATASGADDDLGVDAEPLRYLTVHRRRAPLTISGPRSVVDRRVHELPDDATHADAIGTPPPGCPAHIPGT